MVSRETDRDETINACLFDCFGQATKAAFPGFVCWVVVRVSRQPSIDASRTGKGERKKNCTASRSGMKSSLIVPAEREDFGRTSR